MIQNAISATILTRYQRIGTRTVALHEVKVYEFKDGKVEEIHQVAGEELKPILKVLFTQWPAIQISYEEEGREIQGASQR